MNKIETEYQVDEFDELYFKIFKKKNFDLDDKAQITTFKESVNSFIDEYFEKVATEKRLEKEPKGFHPDKDWQPCCLCDRSFASDEMWQDKNGLKCLTCQNAVKKRIIPISACKNRSSWFNEFDLQTKLEMDSKTIKRKLKSGDLKAREIMNLDGKTLLYRIFLEKENYSSIYEYALKLINS